VERVGDMAEIPGRLLRPVLYNLALVLELDASASSLAIIALVQGARVSKAYPNPDGTYHQQPVPVELPSNSVIILHKYGNLFNAGASGLEELLPSAKKADRPVVILRLRWSDSIASTLINMLKHCEEQLQACGGSLMLAGISPFVKEQLDATEMTRDVLGDERIIMATENIGEGTKLALEAVQAWLERDADEPSSVE
jgi:hypothetical protein